MSETIDWESFSEEPPDFKAADDSNKSFTQTVKETVKARTKTEDKATTTKPRPRPRKRASTPKHGAYKDTLASMYTYVGMGIMVFDQPCGTAVVSSAEQCAQALDDLAYVNENVRRTLDVLTQGSVWSGVIVAHMPIIMAVAAHHGFGGVNSGEVSDTESELV